MTTEEAACEHHLAPTSRCAKLSAELAEGQIAAGGEQSEHEAGQEV
jgi:hypothetical protein